MNSFFQFAETILPECKLCELAKEFPGKSLDYKELDKPIKFECCKAFEGADTNESRSLTDEERAFYGDKLGWSDADARLDKLTIYEDGTLHFKTINEEKEGTVGENGVPYERKTVTVNGLEIEGVFPVFDSKLDVQLPDELLSASDAKQERCCNETLKDKVNKDPELAGKFNSEQIEQIQNGDTPDGYTWHHNEECGKMQLVNTEDHEANRHTGGKAIWGGGTDNR